MKTSKILWIIAAVTAVSVTASTFAFPWFGWGEWRGEDVDRQAVQSAFESWDYSDLPASMQERMTPERFAEMQEKKKSWDWGGKRGEGKKGKRGMKWSRGSDVDHEAVKAAFDAWEYSALPAEAQEKITPNEFSSKVAAKSQMEALEPQFEAAVIANNFTEFSSLVDQKKAIHEANKSEWDNDDKKWEKKKELSEEEHAEKVKEHFDAMVANYQETWEVSLSDSHWKGHGKRGMKDHGKGKNGMKWVKNITPEMIQEKLSKASPEKIAKITTKIDSMLEKVGEESELGQLLLTVKALMSNV